MSLLPDLDNNGFIKEPKKEPYQMPTKGKKKYALEWNNLLLERCPSCGEFWKQSGDIYKCANHDKEFKIGAFKVAKIKRDLQNRVKLRDFIN